MTMDKLKLSIMESWPGWIGHVFVSTITILVTVGFMYGNIISAIEINCTHIHENKTKIESLVSTEIFMLYVAQNEAMKVDVNTKFIEIDDKLNMVLQHLIDN